ncbi:hypothetical protein HNR30_007243 [Nonomuraea soli]|uniref:Uncharacterized protein n=1 Tax=Nonomuraea soli TaxID=1032476 RepID=A0A7W0CRA8_9ACTN|nr:hypothetical protein [Nonomuraea soli]
MALVNTLPRRPAATSIPAGWGSHDKWRDVEG